MDSLLSTKDEGISVVVLSLIMSALIHAPTIICNATILIAPEKQQHEPPLIMTIDQKGPLFPSLWAPGVCLSCMACHAVPAGL